MTNAQTIAYRGCTIKIEYDDQAENPVDSFDQLMTVALHGRARHRFGWGDREASDLVQSAMERVRTARNLQAATAIVTRWLKVFHGATVVLPISAYDHSGVSVSIGHEDGWDSGWIGFVYDTPARREVMIGALADTPNSNVDGKPWGSPESIEWMLRGDFRVFADYVEGDVYGWIATDERGNELDACWGYYGDSEWRPKPDGTDGYMVQLAKEVIDTHVSELDADEAELAELAALELGVPA